MKARDIILSRRNRGEPRHLNSDSFDLPELKGARKQVSVDHMRRRFSEVSYDEKKEPVSQCRCGVVLLGSHHQASSLFLQTLDLYSKEVLVILLGMQPEVIPASKAGCILHEAAFELRQPSLNCLKVVFRGKTSNQPLRKGRCAFVPLLRGQNFAANVFVVTKKRSDQTSEGFEVRLLYRSNTARQ
jgi:hypothetical protein